MSSTYNKREAILCMEKCEEYYGVEVLVVMKSNCLHYWSFNVGVLPVNGADVTAKSHLTWRCG